MKKVKNILTGIFWGLLGISLLLVALFENELLPTGMLSSHLSAEFLCRCTMEVVALVCIWLSLRLFTFRRIRQDLVTRKEVALQKWGTVRLLMLLLPMLLNTILYYVFMQTTYGYLAIIALLCLPFVYPTMGRCMGDVEDEPTSEEDAKV